MVKIENNLKTDPQKGLNDNFLLNEYFKDITRLSNKTMDYQEERKLSSLIKNGDIKARNKLIIANLRFVIKVARSYENQGIDLVDLIEIGNKGLIHAAKHFDGEKNFKFISYAVWWIRQAILKAFSEQSRITKIPLNRSAIIYKIRKASQKLEQKYHRQPTNDEIAKELNLSLKEIELVKENVDSTKLSLDSPLGDTNWTIYDVLADDKLESPSEKAEQGKLNKAVNDTLNKILNSREKHILMMYYGFKDNYLYTLEEIGAEMGITRERVRQLKDFALKKLKNNEDLIEMFKVLENPVI